MGEPPVGEYNVYSTPRAQDCGGPELYHQTYSVQPLGLFLGL